MPYQVLSKNNDFGWLGLGYVNDARDFRYKTMVLMEKSQTYKNLEIFRRFYCIARFRLPKPHEFPFES